MLFVCGSTMSQRQAGMCVVDVGRVDLPSANP